MTQTGRAVYDVADFMTGPPAPPATVVALVPARAGSQRVPHKNRRLLGERPLWQWTTDLAIASQLFQGVYVVTDDPVMLDAVSLPIVALPRATARDDEADIVWLQSAVRTLRQMGVIPDAYMVLRPTSPFRTVDMLRRAWAQFQVSTTDSLRAVEPATDHPGKMWYVDGPGHAMRPVLDRLRDDGVPLHSCPTQSLRPVFRQTASLEIVWRRVIEEQRSLSGQVIMPFLTVGREGFDINTEADFSRAEQMVYDDSHTS